MSWCSYYFYVYFILVMKLYCILSFFWWEGAYYDYDIKRIEDKWFYNMWLNLCLETDINWQYVKPTLCKFRLIHQAGTFNLHRKVGKNRREAWLAKRSAGRGRPCAKRLQEAVFTLHVCSIPARLNCSIYMDYTPWLWSIFKNNLSAVKVDNLPFQSLLAQKNYNQPRQVQRWLSNWQLAKAWWKHLASLWIPSFQTQRTVSKWDITRFLAYTFGRLTWNPRIHPCKRKIIFQTIIFRFYDNLLGGTLNQEHLLRSAQDGGFLVYHTKRSQLSQTAILVVQDIARKRWAVIKSVDPPRYIPSNPWRSSCR